MTIIEETAPAREDKRAWGACGTEGCADCLPLFDAKNNPIPGTNHGDQQ